MYVMVVKFEGDDLPGDIQEQFVEMPDAADIKEYMTTETSDAEGVPRDQLRVYEGNLAESIWDNLPEEE